MAVLQPVPTLAPAPLRVGYEAMPARRALAGSDVLAVIGFGTHTAGDDPREVVVPLHTVDGSVAPCEVWRVHGEVRHGRDGDVAWAEGGGYLFVAFCADESAYGGPEAAADHAYRRLLDCVRRHDHPHLLRAWNYLAAINEGEGDAERYRRFSIGRARGMGDWPAARLPAATAIGHLEGHRGLVVYAIAAQHAGHPVENPRQVSAYHYPRQYGPVPPSFARAMRVDTQPPALLISGTASVVGHATAHVGDAEAQAAETLLNLDTLVRTAGLAERLGGRGACLKAYLRHRGDAPLLRAALAEAGVAPGQALFLHGDICRSELLLEIDGSFVVA